MPVPLGRVDFDASEWCSQGSIDLTYLLCTHITTLTYLVYITVFGQVVSILLGSAVSTKSEIPGFSTKFELSFMYLVLPWEMYEFRIIK